MKIIILGEPKGKQRPRATVRGGHASVYTPTATKEYEKYIRDCFNAHDGEIIMGQVAVSIECYFSIPKSFSKKKRDQCLCDEIRPTKKCDADNIAKVVLDALNGAAYEDDKNVVELFVGKHYDEIPRLEVNIKEV